MLDDEGDDGFPLKAVLERVTSSSGSKEEVVMFHDAY